MSFITISKGELQNCVTNSSHISETANQVGPYNNMWKIIFEIL